VPISPADKQIPKRHSDKITALETRIKWIQEKHPTIGALLYREQLKEELATLLNEEKNKERVRRLPLYTSTSTGFKLVCSTCFDNAYNDNNRAKAKQTTRS
jgi:hypothetical protein